MSGHLYGDPAEQFADEAEALEARVEKLQARLDLIAREAQVHIEARSDMDAYAVKEMASGD